MPTQHYYGIVLQMIELIKMLWEIVFKVEIKWIFNLISKVIRICMGSKLLSELLIERDKIAVDVTLENANYNQTDQGNDSL